MAQMSRTEFRERVERLKDAHDTLALVAALRTAVNALEWYADEDHWSEDGWGVLAVVQPPDYRRAGQKARNAIKRIGRQLG
jgi:hypothetical protein